MNLFEPIEQLEEKEEQLRHQVNDLSEAKKKRFFRHQLAQLKDPDTYAALNFLCVGGFHHLYLGRYKLFWIEFVCLLITVGILLMGYYKTGLYVLLVLVLIELPQLFFSQKIARQRNYEISSAIFDAIVVNPSVVDHKKG